MQSLPVSNFKLMTDNKIHSKITLEKICSISKDSKCSYILEVNMYLPKGYPEKMADCPLAPEKKSIYGTQLSKYQ